MRKLSLLIIFGLAAAALLAACSPSSAQPTVESTTAQPAVLIAEGRLLPVKALDQSFSLPGQVAEILVNDGEVVEKGQVLARLPVSSEVQTALMRARQEVLLAQQTVDGLFNSAELNLTQARLTVIETQKQVEAAEELVAEDDSEENKAALAVAMARLAQAEKNLAMLETGAGVDPDLKAAAEARLASANAALVSAQSALDAFELKASLDGMVIDSTLQVGQRLTAGQPALTVADTSAWIVKTENLTEDEVVGVELGQKVQLTLDALPNKTLNGEVAHINARFEEKRGDITYTVTIALSESDPQMRWGMTAAVQFVP